MRGLRTMLDVICSFKAGAFFASWLAYHRHAGMQQSSCTMGRPRALRAPLPKGHCYCARAARGTIVGSSGIDWSYCVESGLQMWQAAAALPFLRQIAHCGGLQCCNCRHFVAPRLSIECPVVVCVRCCTQDWQERPCCWVKVLKPGRKSCREMRKV